jgi:hypothetical protein
MHLRGLRKAVSRINVPNNIAGKPPFSKKTIPTDIKEIPITVLKIRWNNISILVSVVSGIDIVINDTG